MSLSPLHLHNLDEPRISRGCTIKPQVLSALLALLAALLGLSFELVALVLLHCHDNVAHQYHVGHHCSEGAGIRGVAWLG